MKSIPVTGQKVPDFALEVNGTKTTLKELYSQGPVVLTFYCGGWCPYCILELKAWEKLSPKLKELGLTVIGISPEGAQEQEKTRQKVGLETVSLAPDADNSMAHKLGLVFTVHPEVKAKYKEFGLDLEASQGNDRWELPMPGTYLIDQKGIIRFAQADPDYTVRAEPEHVLTVLRYLN